MQLQRHTINNITIKITKPMNKKFLYISCPIISLQTSHPELFRVMKFGIVGTIAMIIHYSLYYVLMNIIEVNIAFTVGYFISFLCNYLLTSYYTFGISPSICSFFRFGVSHLTNYLIQISVLNAVLYIGVPAVWAPIPVYAISIPISFILVKAAILWKHSNNTK